jgi:hypothetical protein
MPLSTRAKLPYPSEQRDPWFDQFLAFVQAVDSAVYAEREDRNLVIMGGGAVSWDATTNILSWVANIELPASPVGFLWRIVPGSLVVADNQFIYFQAVRSPTDNVNVTLSTGAQVPGLISEDANNSILFGVRRGSRVYFRNGDVIQDGETSNIFESSGATLTINYAVPAALDGGAGSGGVSLLVPAWDHKHPLDMAEVGDIVATATANAAGVSNEIPRADHAHRLEVGVLLAGVPIGLRPKLNFTAGVVVDDVGNDRVNITLNSIGTTGNTIVREFDLLLDTDTDLAGFVAAGGRRFNPADHVLAGTTVAIRFQADAYVTTGLLTGEVQLYNLTTASIVTTLSFVGNTAPGHQESAVLVLTAANEFYEARYRVTGGAAPTDRVFVMSASLKVVNTVT